MTDGYTVKPNDMIIRRTSFHPENASAECDEYYISPEIDSAAVELNHPTFQPLRLPRNVIRTMLMFPPGVMRLMAPLM